MMSICTESVTWLSYINKMKHYRHIFSRFDKLAKMYLAFLHFVGTLIWLK